MIGERALQPDDPRSLQLRDLAVPLVQAALENARSLDGDGVLVKSTAISFAMSATLNAFEDQALNGHELMVGLAGVINSAIEAFPAASRQMALFTLISAITGGTAVRRSSHAPKEHLQ